MNQRIRMGLYRCSSLLGAISAIPCLPFELLFVLIRMTAGLKPQQALTAALITKVFVQQVGPQRPT